MGSSASGNSADPGDYGEIVQFGRTARLRWRWLSALLLTCLVGVAVGVVVTSSGSQGRPAPSAVTTTDVGHPILGVRAGWELFGLGGSSVVAVQFARGQVVRTPIPHLEGDGIASLVPAPAEVLVRPLDNVPGYAVPDGAPARQLTGVLAHGGTLLPGPSAAEQWLVGGTLTLVGPSGTRENAHLPSSALLWATQVPVISDGRGGLVLTDPAGTVYDAGHGPLRPIPSLLLAVGPRNWLGLRCGNGGCRNLIINAATGASRVLPGPAAVLNPWPWQPLPGAVAPDGAVAAVIVTSQATGKSQVELINLTSGAVTRVRVPVQPGSSSHALAWSPDSRWLFVVTAGGHLVAVNPRTARAQSLHLGLSGLSQIVIRPASG